MKKNIIGKVLIWLLLVFLTLPVSAQWRGMWGRSSGTFDTTNIWTYTKLDSSKLVKGAANGTVNAIPIYTGSNKWLSNSTWYIDGDTLRHTPGGGSWYFSDNIGSLETAVTMGSLYLKRITGVIDSLTLVSDLSAIGYKIKADTLALNIVTNQNGDSVISFAHLYNPVDSTNYVKRSRKAMTAYTIPIGNGGDSITTSNFFINADTIYNNTEFNFKVATLKRAKLGGSGDDFVLCVYDTTGVDKLYILKTMRRGANLVTVDSAGKTRLAHQWTNKTDTAFVIDNVVGGAKFLQFWLQNGAAMANIDTTGKLTCVGISSGGTITATTGNVASTLGSVSAGTIVSAGTYVGVNNGYGISWNSGENTILSNTTTKALQFGGNNVAAHSQMEISKATGKVVIAPFGVQAKDTLARLQINCADTGTIRASVLNGLWLGTLTTQNKYAVDSNGYEASRTTKDTSETWGTSTTYNKAGVDSSGNIWMKGITFAQRSVTSSTTFAINDHTIFVTADGDSTRFVTLPSAVTYPGKVFRVKRLNTTGFSVTVISAAGTIDGATVDSLGSGSTQIGTRACHSYQSDGTNWQIISGSLNGL